MNKKIYIALAILAVFIFWGILTIEAGPDSDAKRGCEASAYQASRYGHNLEQNLKVCASL